LAQDCLAHVIGALARKCAVHASSMGKRGSSCGTPGAICFTVCYGITWVLLLAGTIQCHIAVSELLDPLRNVPGSIREGFYGALKFETLAASAASVKSHSQTAVHKCDPSILPSGPSHSECSTVDDTERSRLLALSATTSSEKAAIQQEFTASLDTINKVANDKFFGTEDLQATAYSLNNITSQLDDLPDGDEDCYTIVLGYCKIYKNADAIASSTGEVTKAIDAFYENDFVRGYEEQGDNMRGLHLLPYVLMVSMLCFLLFWCRDAACPCSGSGGSKIGGAAVSCHALLWLVFFVWNTVVTAAGLAVVHFPARVKVEFLKGGPSLEELIEHVEQQYPEFAAIVFEPLAGPGEKFLTACITFEIFCAIIVVYGCCVCCWTPYRDDDDGRVLSISGAP